MNESEWDSLGANLSFVAFDSAGLRDIHCRQIKQPHGNFPVVNCETLIRDSIEIRRIFR